MTRLLKQESMVNTPVSTTVSAATTAAASTATAGQPTPTSAVITSITTDIELQVRKFIIRNSKFANVCCAS